jgi:hypothetical protein
LPKHGRDLLGVDSAADPVFGAFRASLARSGAKRGCPVSQSTDPINGDFNHMSRSDTTKPGGASASTDCFG